MLLDSGIATVKRGTQVSLAGEKPAYTWSELFKSYFGERTVGINRYWSALEHDSRADLLIEIQRNGAIKATDRVLLEPFNDAGTAGTYQIIQVQQILDDDNLPKTLLTLERMEALDA